jgi:hypothetical protein
VVTATVASWRIDRVAEVEEGVLGEVESRSATAGPVSKGICRWAFQP